MRYYLITLKIKYEIYYLKIKKYMSKEIKVLKKGKKLNLILINFYY